LKHLAQDIREMNQDGDFRMIFGRSRLMVVGNSVDQFRRQVPCLGEPPANFRMRDIQKGPFCLQKRHALFIDQE